MWVEWDNWFLFALASGLLFSLFSFQPVLQHGTLRIVLWLSKASPWNYAEFLNYATELRLMQKIGGRYRFVHGLLRDHLIGDKPFPRR